MEVISISMTINDKTKQHDISADNQYITTTFAYCSGTAITFNF